MDILLYQSSVLEIYLEVDETDIKQLPDFSTDPDDIAHKITGARIVKKTVGSYEVLITQAQGPNLAVLSTNLLVGTTNLVINTNQYSDNISRLEIVHR